jgi:hypothetical protein
VLVSLETTESSAFHSPFQDSPVHPTQNLDVGSSRRQVLAERTQTERLLEEDMVQGRVRPYFMQQEQGIKSSMRLSAIDLSFCRF